MSTWEQWKGGDRRWGVGGWGGNNTAAHFISWSVVEMLLQGIHFSFNKMGKT